MLGISEEHKQAVQSAHLEFKRRLGKCDLQLPAMPRAPLHGGGLLRIPGTQLGQAANNLSKGGEEGGGGHSRCLNKNKQSVAVKAWRQSHCMEGALYVAASSGRLPTT